MCFSDGDVAAASAPEPAICLAHWRAYILGGGHAGSLDHRRCLPRRPCARMRHLFAVLIIGLVTARAGP
jgi:hypothetical protein